MVRCWTCGTSVSSYHYKCSSCRNLKELENIHDTISKSTADLAIIQEFGFNALSDRLSEVATILEWGFGELSWQLQQQTDVLRSIDHTLKTPSETKAYEWRLQAEELRRRGVLEESEEFFLKALNEYRLDYRIYMGLAETYLQMSKFDKAMAFLEKSLPHAPKKEIDYRSYSYRLIGHIYACEEDYVKALDALHNAIKLSPDYIDGLYDFAQYMSLVDDDIVDNICSNTFREWGHNWASKDYNIVCLLALQKAIMAKPIYFYLAEKERNFNHRRETVELALKNLLDNARGRVETVFLKIGGALEGIESAIFKTKQVGKKFKNAKLECISIYEEAYSKMVLAKDKVASADFMKTLEAEKIANESLTLFEKSKERAHSERKELEHAFQSKGKDAFNMGEIASISGVLAFFSGLSGCSIHVWIGYKDVYAPFNTFWVTGFLSFFIIMIGIIIYQSYKLYIEKPTYKSGD